MRWGKRGVRRDGEGREKSERRRRDGERETERPPACFGFLGAPTRF